MHITIVNFISAVGLGRLMDFARCCDLVAQESLSNELKKNNLRKSNILEIESCEKTKQNKKRNKSYLHFPWKVQD